MAIKTVSNTGGNWNAAATWVGGVAPVAGTDTVAFTATSGNLTVNTASACIGIDFTSWGVGKTLTCTALLTVNGPVNLGDTLWLQAGASGIAVTTTATHTFNTAGGFVWSRVWTFTGPAQTHTLSGNFTFTGTLNFDGVTTMVINGGTINTLNLTQIGQIGGTVVSGSSNIVFNGTGTWTSSYTSVYISNNININTGAGTLTIPAGVIGGGATLTYTSGNVSFGNIYTNLNVTLNTNGMTWFNVNIASSGTITLTSDLTWSGFLAMGATPTFAGVGILVPTSTGGMTFGSAVSFTIPSYIISLKDMVCITAGIITLTSDITLSGLLTIGTGSVTTTINNDGTTRTITVNGGITSQGTNSIITGTANIKITGGTITGATTAVLRNNLEIAGNITFASGATFFYDTGTLTYTSGTVTTTNSTLGIVASTTLTTNGITWANINITANATVTLTNNLTWAGQIIINTAAVVFAGAGILVPSPGGFQFNGTATNIIPAYITSLGTLTFRQSSTFVLTSDITLSGLLSLGTTTTAVVINNDGTTRTITAGGGILLEGTTSIISGTVNIVATGGTITGVSTVTLRNNLEIAGDVTFASGVTFTYNTGTLSYTSGNVITAGSTLAISASATLDLGLMPTALNNLTTSGVSPTITLLSDLYVSGTLTLTSTGTPVWTGNMLYIGGNLIHQTNSIQTGTTTFVMNGTGTWTSTSINCIIRNNFTINTTGKITFGALVVYNTGTFTYLSGNVVAPKNSIISIGVGTTLINCHKINFETVQITQSTTITMNEFFSGSPNKPVKVISSSTNNYNITFQNGYEKIAKFVKVSNLTLTNTAASKGSLLILNNKGKYFRGSNNIGNIRYTNTTPNGIAKGEPTVPNQMTAPIGGYLSDPVFN